MKETLNQTIQESRKDDAAFGFLQKKSVVEKIKYQEICYIYKQAKNCVYVCEDGTNYLERISLTRLSEELHRPEMILVGKSYIVNMNHIKRLDRQDIFFDCLDVSIHIPVQQVEIVKKALFQFLKGE